MKHANAQPASPVATLWKRKKVEEVTTMGRSWIYEKMANGEFPRPINLGGGRVAWIATEVQEWIAARIAERG